MTDRGAWGSLFKTATPKTPEPSSAPITQKHPLRDTGEEPRFGQGILQGASLIGNIEVSSQGLLTRGGRLEKRAPGSPHLIESVFGQE